ncbi:MAG TPA: vWA domain-containing protein [Polyangiales bacterium]|nr:vWA domain-containing protein [Polyangiales bacterium]
MCRSGSLGSWVVGCALLLACSAEQPLRSTLNSAPGPGSGAAGSGNNPGKDSSDSKSPSTPDLSTDNPDGVVPTPPPEQPMTMQKPDAGDGCEPGKFCEPKGPDGDCGSERVNTDTKTVQKPGNVLVIYDRSGSMDAAWNGTPKYQSAGNAITAALMPLKDLLTIGGVFFPSQDPNACACNVADPFHWIPGPQACCLNGIGNSCFVSDIAQADQIKFGPADAYIAALPMQYRLAMANGTPLETGVQRGAEALSGTKLDGPVAVIIITDGEPNCNTNPANVLAQVTKWKDAGIPTHVIGLPGAQAAADVLNMIAQAGGTEKYVDPADVMELEAKIRSILTSTIRAGFESCTFKLDKSTMVPEKLHLVITENGQDKDVPRDLSKMPNWGADAGWSINKEGDTVELKGRLCELAKEGSFEALRFNYGCVDFPPPDPPPGPS